MFGLLTPCTHGAAKYGIDPAEWRAHMCGLCLGLRDGHGQLARAATNTDAMVLSMLTEAQLPEPMERTTAGPCALRGMRRASVPDAQSPGVLLAATASLLLGAAKIRDHVDDGDGSALARRPMVQVSDRWAERARAQARVIGLDVEPLVAAIDSQARLERSAAPSPFADVAAGQGISSPNSARAFADGAGRSGARPNEAGGVGAVCRPIDVPRARATLDELTTPTQLCASELFAHTAVLADRPENVFPLREAGRQFGRIAHLADAIEDFDDDRARGRFNPLAATDTTMPEAYDLLRTSELSLREAITAADLDATPVVRWMLLDPLAGLVHRMAHGIGAIKHAAGCSTEAHYSDPNRPRKPSIPEGIGLLLGQYPTGYACFADHTRPCSGRRKKAWRKRMDCCDCCDCGCDCC